MSILFYGQIQIQPNQNKIKATKLQEFFGRYFVYSKLHYDEENFLYIEIYIYRDIYIKKLRKKNIVHIYIGKF